MLGVPPRVENACQTNRAKEQPNSMNSPHTFPVLLASSAGVFYFWGQVEEDFDVEIKDGGVHPL